MPEQELDLLQLATTFVAEAAACATKVMRRDFAQVASGGRLLDNTPDHLGTETVRGNAPRFVDRAEDRAIGDVRSRHPLLKCIGNPERDWDGPNMTTKSRELRSIRLLRASGSTPASATS